MLNTQMPTLHRILGGTLGGLVAGLVLSVWMLIGEVVSKTPSQLTQMERQIGQWFGGTTALGSPSITLAEEYAGNFGHLALSAVMGLAYALLVRKGSSVWLSGAIFGAAFYIAAHAIVGPALGLTPGMWNMPRPAFLTGCVINLFFGLCTAFFAHNFDRDKGNGPLAL
jgi:uncharacterized membrane protein YagU involved in acid resistance